MTDVEITAENFIGGQFVPCRRLIDSTSPSTGKVWARLPDSGKVEIDAAVSAAKRAFPSWSALPSQKRADYLLRVADIIETRLDEFAIAESRDQGKPVWLCKKMDIPRTVVNFRHFAHTFPHMLNTSNVQPEFGTLNYTTREPVGVAGIISPWNLPLYLLSFKLGPALASGNTVVAKPSEFTSITAYMLCKVFQEAGLPDGVINVVFGTGPSTGEPLVSHADVPLISFTGSTATGKRIAQATAPFFKKTSLEMGGKNAAIIFADADLDMAVQTLLRSSFINQGQVCLCSSRIFVHKDIYDKFLTKFVEATRKLKVGPPECDDSFLSAVNSAPHEAKVRLYIKYAVEDGGIIQCGEGVDKLNLPLENHKGYFILPTVVTDLDDSSRCMQEEIFGPVACVAKPFANEDEAVVRANNTEYGLCAAVFTSNLQTAHRVAQKLQVGTVWTNCWLVRCLDMPFGGVKKSGVGSEGTHDSYNFYTKSKTICTKFA